MIARTALFCSSYVPLFAIFAIRFPHTASLWWIISAICTAGGASIVLVARNRHEPQYYRVASVENDGATAAYIATYILPFVTISEPTSRDLFAYGIFFLVVLILNIRSSSLVGINPLVYLTPWRIYQLKTSGGQAFIIFSRERPKVGESIRAAPAFSGLLVRKE
jgi:hypothetical protein